MREEAQAPFAGDGGDFQAGKRDMRGDLGSGWGRKKPRRSGALGAYLSILSKSFLTFSEVACLINSLITSIGVSIPT